MHVRMKAAERRGRVVSEAYSMKAGTSLCEVVPDERLPDSRERLLLAADELAGMKR